MKFSSIAGIITYRIVLVLLCAGVCFSPVPAGALSGDCDNSGSVSITELQSGINMFLGLQASAPCVDTNGGGVSIAELQQTVYDYMGMLPAAKQVTGVVKDPVKSDAVISGATVKVYLEGGSTPVKTVTTTTSGTFSVAGLLSGQDYTFVFSRTGYADTSYFNVNPSHLSDTPLEPVRLLQSALMTQTADINGYIASAETNARLSGIMLQFRAGIGATTGELQPFSRSTDSTGYYSRTFVPAGVYTATVIDTSGGDPATWRTLGHFTVYAVPGVNFCNNSQNYSAVTGIGTPVYRAVLSWGNSPVDLDFHLTGPVAPDDLGTTIGDPPQPRFHIDNSQIAYPYGSAQADLPNVPGALTDVYLDMDYADHGNDNGPETFTILNQRAGTYKFYVFRNSTTGVLGTSGAQVRLYKGAVLLQTFDVPVQSGTTWHVFNLDGDTATPVNVMSNVLTSTLAKRVPGAPFDETTLFKEIVKVPRAPRP